MPSVILDGIQTEYNVIGSGPALLMFAPGGFDATMDKWSTLGIYAKVKLLDHLPDQYTCILFDRRETGNSGGRVERITWADYAAQGQGLLDHLGYEAAHLLGGCMGCCPVAAFATAYPAKTLSMVQYWPVGGPGFRLNAHRRFAIHLAYVEEHGLEGVVSLAKSTTQGFGKDPRPGPWGPVIRRSAGFAAHYRTLDVAKYKLVIAGLSRTLFDRDTVPGAEPEDLMCLDIPTLIIPGRDASHSVSAARYLEECSLGAEYWDVLPESQTEQTAPARILKFLNKIDRKA
ncbi:hydrolase [Pseudomonas agarici]|uniref:Hydrolase n=1 Tax=Pseudomonas agarici TaxID=46677 RepID=A0A0X1SZ25_PSEAA|nr:alpha/beta hydrolase [Pseudomonas agarici]AMB85076.1 hydrolase [Pseudomonas agarici]